MTEARKIIRGWDGLAAYIGYKRTQAQSFVAQGKLKPPMRLGPRAVGWWESDVAEFQKSFSRKEKTR